MRIRMRRRRNGRRRSHALVLGRLQGEKAEKVTGVEIDRELASAEGG